MDLLFGMLFELIRSKNSIIVITIKISNNYDND